MSWITETHTSRSAHLRRRRKTMSASLPETPTRKGRPPAPPRVRLTTYQRACRAVDRTYASKRKEGKQNDA